MDWIYHFDLFLFDFDGLLVNTERLHFQAYQNAVKDRGFLLPFDFKDFLKTAHVSSSTWKEAVLKKMPQISGVWEEVYAEKKKSYQALLRSQEIDLMPGVEPLLSALEKAAIRRCIVTHSNREEIDFICSQNRSLSSIPYRITRDDYHSPKPDPQCYLKAMELYGKPKDKVIGFEDSIRGFEALLQTAATPVMVCSLDYPLLSQAREKGGFHFESLEKINDFF